MQTPQLLGILIGVGIVGVGLIFKRLLIHKGKRTAGSLIFLIFSYLGLTSALQNAIFSYSPSWSWDGVFLVWSEFFGKALVPVTLAFLGFFYRSNKIAGYLVALIIFTFLLMVGNT